MTYEYSDGTVWTVGSVSEDVAASLSQQLDISPFAAKIIAAKGFCDVKSAKKYLYNSYESLQDPYLLKDMEKAVERIRYAQTNNQKILIYGDYDVDGVTSVSVFLRYLLSKGVNADYYIPQRVNEGYGLNISAINKFKQDGVDLIITVDSGITAHDEVEFAKQNGIDVVITDHHECRDELPEACAVVNPHRRDCEYPFSELAGVGVVFKLVCALEDNKNVPALCRAYCDLVALGTVADVMPLVGENRVIVSLGLKQLENTKNKGLAALAAQSFSERTKAKRKNLTASSIGFGLAPRINAAGRIGDVNRAVRLMITDNAAEAQNIASYLCAVNRERQVIENNIFNQAVERIENEFDFEKQRVIVLESDSWHIGVIGIVASKITERYKLPSILISVDGEVGKGSCRSVNGFNINEALSACSDLLVKYGGHELAAGLTVNKSDIEAFKQKINEYAENTFDFSSVHKCIDADFEARLSDVTVNNAVEIQKLEPFGLMNPVPLFYLKDVTVAEIYSIGEGKHLKLQLEKDGNVVTALYFGMTRENFPFSEGDRADFMANIDLNDFRGTLSVQLLVKDVKMTSEDIDKRRAEEETFAGILEGGGCSKEDIPTVKEFRAAFMYLRRVLGIDTQMQDLDVWQTAGIISREYMTNISQLMLNIILCVLCETGIAEMSRYNENHVLIKLNKTTGKVNLDESEILIRLKCGILN